MSNADYPGPGRWNVPPFVIDETPDPPDEAPAAFPPGPASQAAAPPAGPDRLQGEIHELQGAMARVQSAVERLGRELYKHTTRLDPLLTLATRLRADVATPAAEAPAPSTDAVAAAIASLLPVLDGLEHLAAATRAAVEAAGATPATDVLTHLGQTIAVVQEKSAKALSDLGLTPIDSVGHPFDNRRQAVVDTVDDPERPARVVVEEEVKGYLYRGQVLRRAQVIVNRPREENLYPGGL